MRKLVFIFFEGHPKISSNMTAEAHQISAANVKCEWPTITKTDFFVHCVKMTACTKFCENQLQCGAISSFDFR